MFFKEIMLLNYLTVFYVFIYITKIKTFSWMNTVSLYLFSWSTLLFTYYYYSDSYIEISLTTITIIIISLCSFYVGSFIVLLPASHLLKNNHQSIFKIENFRVKIEINKDKFKTSIYVVFLIGLYFFAIYSNSLLNLHGLKRVFFTLLDTRMIMNNEGALPGFHYFYFWEMILPLSVLYAYMYGLKKSFFVLLIGFISMFCLILTGAKTNIFKTITWVFIILLMLNSHRLSLKKFLKYSLIFSSSGFILFFIHTSFTGEISGFENQLNEIFLRFSAQIPTFHLLINDNNISFQYGKLLLLPLTKIFYFLFDGSPPPSHILSFYDTPVPFNLATYLDIFYRDFGVLGVIIAPSFFGLISSYIFYLQKKYDNNFFVFFLLSIIYLWILETPNAAGFIKPNYWVQILTLWIIYLFSKNKISSPNK